MNKITPVYDRVKHLLEKYLSYRDSDYKLVSNIWWNELFGNVAVNRENCKMELFDFLMKYSNADVTPADSITRARRKVQEEYPHLRGETYKQRKLKEAENVKEEIRGLANS